MACQLCHDGDFGEADQVEDRAALGDFVTALLTGDVRLARIMASRNFFDSDLAAIETAIVRAPAPKKEIPHV